MTSAPYVLGFDTSGSWCAVALIRGRTVLCSLSRQMARGQAEALMPLLDSALSTAGIGWKDLSAIGVGVGPGNFTGIRIAVSAARGLSLGLGVPAVGVTGCEARISLCADDTIPGIAAPRDNLYLCTGEMDVPPLMSATEADAFARARDLTLRTDFPPRALSEAIAHHARDRFRDTVQPPAPLYARPADAAPSRDTPPVLLD